MGAATAVAPAEETCFASRAEMREVLSRLLQAVNADERIGPLFRASGVATRFEFPDLDLVLNVAATPEAEDHCIEWRFSDDVPWRPDLRLTMDSSTANRYLQGEIGLAIALARGLVRCEAKSRPALVFVPTARLLVEPYQRLLAGSYPHLALDQ